MPSLSGTDSYGRDEQIYDNRIRRRRGGRGPRGLRGGAGAGAHGIQTLLLSLNLDSIALWRATLRRRHGKGQLVREIDALGGEMGRNADKTALQMRMLNAGKGAAVQSLRSQADKHAYHAQMKRTLENTEI